MLHPQSDLLPEVIFLMGPTASGKTALAMRLRDILPVEIISVDSALIYRGMDIGTAKPSPQELLRVPHRLLDILDPAEHYSAAQFRRDALQEIEQIITAGRIPLLVGGTMLYFKALLEGLSPLPPANKQVREQLAQMACRNGWPALHQWLAQCDPIAAKRIHPNDPQRLSRALEVFLVSGKTLTELTKISGTELPYRVTQYAIVPASRELLHQRISARFHKMLQSGFEFEVRSLISRKDLNMDMPSMRCVGYRQMWSWLVGEISYDEMVFQSVSASRQLAKRQLTWLRGWRDLTWLDSEQLDDACETVRQVHCA